MSESADALQAMLSALAPNLQELAQELEVSYASLYAWSSGRRRPSARHLQRLADLADRRAEGLSLLANQLRRSAQKQGAPGTGSAVTAGPGAMRRRAGHARAG